MARLGRAIPRQSRVQQAAPVTGILLTNNASGGTNGATVTSGSGGNSGGVSGDYFTSLAIGASSSLTFDQVTGPVSWYEFANASGDATYVQWTPSGQASRGFALRAWFKDSTGSNPSVQETIAQIRSNVGNAQMAALAITTGGFFKITNASGGAPGGTDTGSIAIPFDGSIVEFRFWVRGGTTTSNGEIHFDWYRNGVFQESLDAVAANTTTDLAATFRIGRGGAAAAARTYRFSMLAGQTNATEHVALAPAPPTTGTAAQTLPRVTQSAAGTATSIFTGISSQILPGVTQAATGTHTTPVFTGITVQTLPKVTQSAAGTAEAEYTGSIAQGLPRITQAASGTAEAEYTGASTQTLQRVAQSASGTVTAPVFTGASAQVLPSLAQSASGSNEPEYTGSVAQTLPHVTQAASGTLGVPVFTGTSAQALPRLTQAASGTNEPEYVGTADQTLQPVTQAANGNSTAPAFTGTVAQTLPVLSQSAVGTSEPEYVGDVDQSLPSLTQVASGTVENPTGVTTRAFDGSSPPTDAQTDNDGVVLGTEFYVTETAWATHVFWFQPTTNSPSTASREGGIFQVDSASTGTLMGSTVTQPPSGSGWQSMELPAPVELVANQRYRVAIRHPAGRYISTPNYYTSGGPGATDQTFDGLLVVPTASNATNGEQGTYWYGGTFSFPEGSFNNSNYWSDVTVTNVNPSAPGTSTGDIAQTLPNLDQSAIGSFEYVSPDTYSDTYSDTYGESSFISQILPAVTQAASGLAEAEFTGTIGQALPKVTQAATGTAEAEYIGTAAQILPKVTQAVTGTAEAEFTGTSAQVLPRLTQAATGTAEAEYTGAVSQVLPRLTQTASGTAEAEYVGSIGQTLRKVAQAASGTFALPAGAGTVAQTLPRVTQSISGTVEAEYTGVVIQTLPHITQSGAGVFTGPPRTGIVNQTLSKVSQAITGEVGNPPGNIGIVGQTLPKIVQTVSGTITAPVSTGSVAQTLPRITQIAWSGAPAVPSKIKLTSGPQGSLISITSMSRTSRSVSRPVSSSWDVTLQ